MRLIRLLKGELAREARSWVDKDIVSVSQAEQICALYDADFSGQSAVSRGHRFLGICFLGWLLLLLLVLIGMRFPELSECLGWFLFLWLLI